MAVWEEARTLRSSPQGLLLRGQDYGHPYEDFSRTAKIWSAILGIEVTPQQAILCMIAVKISRECHRPKRDNRVDIAGYAEALDMVVNYREHGER